MKRSASRRRSTSHRPLGATPQASSRVPERTTGPSEPLRVLVLGSPETSQELGDLFARLGWIITQATDLESVRPSDVPFDLVFVDGRYERKSRTNVYHIARVRWPEARVVRLRAESRGQPGRTPDSRWPGHVPDRTDGGRFHTPGPSTPDGPNAGPPHDLGIGRLEPSPASSDLSEERDQKVLRIDASGAPPRLLGRLLVGGYITGQDRVVVTAPEDLTTLQREEIQRTAHRILGMTVVVDRRGRMEVQSFLDPAKYGFVPLLNRTVWMLRAQLELCRRALDGSDQDFLPDVEEVEEGVDRLYLLMVRQLILSCDSPLIARRIEVESRHYQIGDRLVAKVLEVIGDLIREVGTELAAHREGFQTLSPDITRELAGFLQRFDSLLKRTAESFVRTSPFDANALLDEIQSSRPHDSTLGDELARKISDPELAIAAERVVWSLVLGLDMLVVVNEVTINRSVEPISGGGSGATLHFPNVTRSIE